MNSLIVFPEEMKDAQLAILSGARAKEVLKLHELRPGIKIAASLLGHLRGKALVSEVSGEQVILQCEFINAPPKRQAIEIILAIPRPQTIKKVLNFCAVAGLEAVNFVLAENTQKSYLQSKSLKEEEIKRQIVLGLEQAYDCIPPRVAIFHRLKDFLDLRIASTRDHNCLRLIAQGNSSGEEVSTEEFKSISSMKITLGAAFLASSKRLLTREAPTPTSISTKSEPEI